MPHADIELPEGDEPIVLVASSTAQDPACDLIRRSFEGLADEPVRVVATTNGHSPPEPIDVPANGMLVPWLSYSQLMPLSSVVVCHGGHGTVARALSAGRPLVISPSIGDMAENAQRVAWAGCGLTVPGRLRRGTTLRWAVQRVLGDPGYRTRRRGDRAERVVPRRCFAGSGRRGVDGYAVAATAGTIALQRAGDRKLVSRSPMV